MQIYHVSETFIEPMLGTVPKDPEVYKNWILSRAPKAEEADDELETVVDEDKGWTGFHRLNGDHVLYDYMIKGFFKEACGALRRVKGTKSSEIKAYKKMINDLLFVYPRLTPLVLPPGQDLMVLERPLRASGPQGERVALARSDACPAGTTMEYELRILGGIDEKLLGEWLDYGAFKGRGQWRSGGYGRFEYELKKA